MKRIIQKGLKIIRNILVGAVVFVLSIILLLIGWNQVMCLKSNDEICQVGKNITVEGRKMRVYEVGSGSKTIVMLSGLGTYSPIIDYKPLAELLSSDYRVVVLEYFGYGQSDDTNEPRTAENIVEEIREAMQVLEIKPPYILMPHSISGIYSMQYANMYPNEIAAIVGIEMSIPNQTKYGKQGEISSFIRILARACDLTGITRMEFLEDQGYFKDMAAGGYYTKEEIKLAKEIACRNTASKALVAESNCFVDNSKPLYDVKYSKDLPVLTFIATDSNTQFDQYMKELGEHVTWQGLHERAYTNPAIQKISTLVGGHYLHWTQADEIAKQTKTFLAETLKD